MKQTVAKKMTINVYLISFVHLNWRNEVRMPLIFAIHDDEHLINKTHIKGSIKIVLLINHLSKFFLTKACNNFERSSFKRGITSETS